MGLFLKPNFSSSKGGWLLLGSTWILFFGRILSGRYIYFLDDLKILYYPLEVAYASFQHTWQLPLWSPLFGFGQPLLAWGQLGFFTPLHVLLRIFQINPLNLLQISVVAYWALGLAGFYILLRQHRLVPFAAATGAIIYAFSGFNIGHLNHVNFYVGTMVLPWLLVGVTHFIRQPTLSRAATMALLASALALSAQPQIVLYSFCMAGIYGAILLAFVVRQETRRFMLKIGLYTILSALIAFLLSSLAILPLAEFLPETERSADLPVEELLDFSYAPSHAITLLAPYFFGDHSSYWGAKGFQELAAFTGILPLLLAGFALIRWHTVRPLRISGLLLILIGTSLALGRYSPLYSYLVTHHFITTLNIPGRFVFFFTTGIALLAATGLHDMSTYSAHRSRRFIELVMPLLVLSFILIPFATALTNPIVANQAKTLVTTLDPSFLLATLGLVIYYITWYFLPRLRKKQGLSISLSIATAITLVVLGYNYTPVSLRSSLTNSLVFTDSLASFERTTGLPARLYSRDVLLNDVPRHKIVATQPLSPRYTVFQPIIVTIPTNPCFIIPMQSATAEGVIEVSLLSSLTGPVLDSQLIEAHRTVVTSEQRVCFSATVSSPTPEAYLRFSSRVETTVRLGIYPIKKLSVYLVRTENPTPEIIAASQKPHRIDLTEDLTRSFDTETFLLARHLQVVGRASSARWIGALSIKPYREFIEDFLANDKDKPFTGDGLHIIEDNRAILDMLGITHLAQQLLPESTDKMVEANYHLRQEEKAGATTYRLYENPQAFPKAWLVPQAIFIPSADETRHAINQPDFDPKKIVYISGPKPPLSHELTPEPTPDESSGSVHIVSYEPTRVVLQVDSPRDTWLVVSDTTTPEWQTVIDNNPAPQYSAHTFMKAAFVPAGEHTVSFIYDSPATNRALKMTYAGLILLSICYIVSLTSRSRV